MVLILSLQIKTGFVSEVQTHTPLCSQGRHNFTQGYSGEREYTEHDENVS